MDVENREEEFDRRKALKILCVAMLACVVSLLCIFIFSDFLDPCTGWIISGMSASIVYVILYFFIRTVKKPRLKYIYFPLALLVAWQVIRYILNACISECP
jgi:amino acid transporter